MTKTGGFAEFMRLLPRAAVLATVMWLPLMAMEGVRAGQEDIIEHVEQKSSGAGLVILVSLQRAQ